ncbi:hypothetical protein B0H13DRAFT_2570042 [Mycena leptocephala]|nr:hypothetical protein B0H13DRAFT_2570042 [Mycena leptocephala]
MEHGGSAGGAVQGSERALTGCLSWNTAGQQEAWCRGRNEHSRAAGDGTRRVSRRHGAGVRTSTHILPAMEHGGSAGGMVQGSEQALTACRRWNTAGQQEARCRGRNEHSRPAGDGTRQVSRRRGAEGSERALTACRRWNTAGQQEARCRGQNEHSRPAGDGTRRVSRRRGAGVRMSTHILPAMEHGGSAGGAVQGSERALTGCLSWNTAGQQEARCRGQNKHSRPAGDGTRRVSRRRGAGVGTSTHVLPAMEHGGSAGGAVQRGQNEHSRPAGDGTRRVSRRRGAGVRTSTHVLPAMEHGGSAGGMVQGSERALTACQRWNMAGQQEVRCRGRNEHSHTAGDGTRRVSRRRCARVGTSTHILPAMEHGGSAGGAVQGSERALTYCQRWNTAGQQEARCRGWNEHSHPASDGTRRVSRRRGAGVGTSTHVLPAMEHGGSAGGAVQGLERALTACQRWNTAGQQEALCRGRNEHSHTASDGTRRVSRRHGAGVGTSTHSLPAMEHGGSAGGAVQGSERALTYCQRWNTAGQQETLCRGRNEHSHTASDGTQRVSRRRGAGVGTSTHVLPAMEHGGSAGGAVQGWNEHSRLPAMEHGGSAGGAVQGWNEHSRLPAMEHGGSAGGAVQGSERALTYCQRWNTAVSRRRGAGVGTSTHVLPAMEHGGSAGGAVQGSERALTACRRWNTAGQQEARCRGRNEHSHTAGDGTRRVSRRRGAGVGTSTHILPVMEHSGSAGGTVQGSERALTGCRRWNTAGQQEARCRHRIATDISPNRHLMLCRLNNDFDPFSATH